MGHGGQGRVPIPPKNMQNLHVSLEPLPSCVACFDGGGERKVAGPSRVGVDQVQCPQPLRDDCVPASRFFNMNLSSEK
jgi:hypothetical protein